MTQSYHEEMYTKLTDGDWEESEFLDQCDINIKQCINTPTSESKQCIKRDNKGDCFRCALVDKFIHGHCIL